MFAVDKILVPFDFSETSHAALSLALQLVQVHGAELHLLSVERNLDKEVKKRIVSAPQGTLVERTIQDNERSMLEAVRQELARADDAGHPMAHPQVNLHVMGGAWNTAVFTLVEEREIDCIVVGTHGRQGLLEAIRGTETEEWVRRAPCSVLVVKPQGYPYLRD